MATSQNVLMSVKYMVMEHANRPMSVKPTPSMVAPTAWLSGRFLDRNGSMGMAMRPTPKMMRQSMSVT